MELYKEYLLPNIGSLEKSGMLALYMGGAVPTTAAELKAAVDIYDFQDMYAKCLGVSAVTLAGSAGQTFTLTQSPGRTAMKKCAFNYAFTPSMNSLIPADMRKASIPDRMFLCNVATPFARAANMGISSFWSNNITPWQAFEGNYSSVAYPVFPGRSEMFGAGLTTCVEFEWDAPRNFGGVLRSANYGVGQANGSYSMSVEAWNGTAWEVVRPAIALSYGTSTITYVAFTKRIVTTKLRISVTPSAYPANISVPHGIVPLEVTADSPAPVAPADITWAILLPMVGSYVPTNSLALSRLTDPSHPVPLYACKVGGPGESAPAVDMVLHKCRDLTVTDLPALSGMKVMTSNMVE